MKVSCHRLYSKVGSGEGAAQNNWSLGIKHAAQHTLPECAPEVISKSLKSAVKKIPSDVMCRAVISVSTSRWGDGVQTSALLVLNVAANVWCPPSLVQHVRLLRCLMFCFLHQLVSNNVCNGFIGTSELKTAACWCWKHQDTEADCEWAIKLTLWTKRGVFKKATAEWQCKLSPC